LEFDKTLARSEKLRALIDPVSSLRYNGRKNEFKKFRFSSKSGEDEMDTKTVKIRQKGVITLPVEVRREYDLDEGDIFTLVDLGEGALMLIPQLSQVARLGDQVAAHLEAEELSLDDLLEALDDEREAYYREHYEQA
jgi:AbrB family looped-hinge helix DNA binding protein